MKSLYSKIKWFVNIWQMYLVSIADWKVHGDLTSLFLLSGCINKPNQTKNQPKIPTHSCMPKWWHECTFLRLSITLCKVQKILHDITYLLASWMFYIFAVLDRLPMLKWHRISKRASFFKNKNISAQAQ